MDVSMQAFRNTHVCEQAVMATSFTDGDNGQTMSEILSLVTCTPCIGQGTQSRTGKLLLCVFRQTSGAGLGDSIKIHHQELTHNYKLVPLKHPCSGSAHAT